MKFKRKNKYILFLILPLYIIFFTSCGKSITENKSHVGDGLNIQNIIYDKINPILQGSESKCEIFYDTENISKLTEYYGFSEDTIKLYDNEYFTKYVLVIVAIGTTPEPQYTVSKVQKHNSELVIYMDERKSQNQNSLLVGVGVLIEMEKDALENVKEAHVEINTIYTE